MKAVKAQELNRESDILKTCNSFSPFCSAAMWREPTATTAMKLLHSLLPVSQIAPLRCHGARAKPALDYRLVMPPPQVALSQTFLCG